MIVQGYEFRCDVDGCDGTHVDVTPLQAPQPLDGWPAKPVLPVAWRRIDEHIVCPRHAIAIDGRATQLGTIPAA